MKKIFLFSIILFTIIFLTGCGKEETVGQQSQPVEKDPKQEVVDYSDNPVTPSDLDSEINSIDNDLQEIEEDLNQLDFDAADEKLPSLE